MLRRFVAAGAVAFLLASCAPSVPEPGGSNAAETSTVSPDTPPATEAEVLAAVKEGETATKLPDSITPQQLSVIAKADISLWGLPSCNPDYEDTSIADLSKCTLGAPDGTKTMVVVGDSNAFMWAKGLDFVGKRKGWKVVVLGKDNCGPAAILYYQYQLKRDFTECDTFQKWRTDQIQALKPAAVVLIGWYGGNTGPDRQLTPQMWRDGLTKTIGGFPPGTKTVLLANVPHITQSPGECLSKNMNDISKCAEAASDVVPVEGNDAIKQAATDTQSTYVEVTPWFCGTTCPFVIAGKSPYAGRYHITHDYAQYLSGVLADAMQPAMS